LSIFPINFLPFVVNEICWFYWGSYRIAFADLSALGVFLSHFLVGAEDEDGSGVALDVVELLEEVDACEVVGLPILTEVPQLFL
jgi:hypothetical protein